MMEEVQADAGRRKPDDLQNPSGFHPAALMPVGNRDGMLVETLAAFLA